MTVGPPESTHWCVIGRTRNPDRPDEVAAVDLDSAGEKVGGVRLGEDELADFVRDREAAALRPRWVFSDAPRWYPAWLAAGVRIGRCHDLRLAHAILMRSELVTEPGPLREAADWDAGPVTAAAESDAVALFDVEGGRDRAKEVPHDIDSALAEFARQHSALATAADPGRLRLLLAAESAGALVAAEMHAAGAPWDVAEHDRILTEVLGPRPPLGAKPAKMQAVAEEVRVALEDPRANLDSHAKLLSALHRAGINVASTSKWELAESDHPAIEPLLRYKKLARLLSANGWHWLDEWIESGRYRPVYVPGGVVTGRWAASGGGALQIPRQLRPALRADPGWTLISADVAQLEPRALAAMSGDRAMAEAGREKDLYSGIVDSGIVATRQEAKIAVLGAMYGGTTGDSGRLVPRLRTSFPQAMALVDSAAEVGAAGGVVSTWLGRTSPVPSEGWRQLQARANRFDATAQDEAIARRAAGDQGRFTRNFVVQGTAAEWALAWLADLRLRLSRLPATTSVPASPSGPVFDSRAHLVFFLHDEVIVHSPLDQAEDAAEAIRAAAASAGRLLFGDAPVDFPLDLTIAERAVKE
ncbi:bifunctional 3'-5' exonuclease/DNA polymerase [Brevibacterium sp.]|uniref:bifunctional 3'-5' exonuclease/DNA polymerase n=1 Tax=Brevibacterium sp. TaxID=1701 RepID=UPI002810D284|nr:bifunctional 3'-5' exonuclease/DNA polymerase [Brevibacterium sp.]